MDLSRPWVVRGLVIALAAVVGVVVWMAASGDDEEEPAAPAEAGAARIVSEEELTGIAASAGHPVYWAGEVEGAELELTEEGGGRVLVRYLSEDDELGTGFGRRVAVDSYRLPNPRKALANLAETPGWTVQRLPEVGRVAIGPEGRNVYFADPGNEVQVEVYAPSAKRALGLLRSGRVQPVG